MKIKVIEPFPQIIISSFYYFIIILTSDIMANIGKDSKDIVTQVLDSSIIQPQTVLIWRKVKSFPMKNFKLATS